MFFEGYPKGLALFEAVRQVIDGIGESSVKVTKSQITFRHRKGFAYVWRPGPHLDSDVPAVLSIALPYELSSQRF